MQITQIVNELRIHERILTEAIRSLEQVKAKREGSISPGGRQRIAEAMKKRWANHRAAAKKVSAKRA